MCGWIVSLFLKVEILRRTQDYTIVIGIVFLLTDFYLIYVDSNVDE